MKKQDKPEKRLPLYQSLLWITCSILCISGVAFATLSTYKKKRVEKLLNPAYHITKIVQTGPQKKALSSCHLAEILDLSCDKPGHLLRFSKEKAEEKLLDSPLIRAASVELIAPNTIYIDYDVRRPVALISDYENVAIDQEGYLFPYRPFFTMQKLPEIYLGLAPFNQAGGGKWNEPLSSDKARIALEFIELYQKEKFPFELVRVDLSNSESPSFGRRELVVTLNETHDFKSKSGSCDCYFPKILRLSTKNYAQQIGNFLVLREKMIADYRKQVAKLEVSSKKIEFAPQVIDFRIPELAFIQEASSKKSNN